jgi:adenylate kinase
MTCQTNHRESCMKPLLNFFLLFIVLSSSLCGGEKLVLLLMGSPGSGKTTLASHLSEYYQIPQISAGALLRQEVAKNSEIGQECRSYLESGSFVPDSIVLSIVLNRIKREDCAGGYILDGFPRNLTLWTQFETWLEPEVSLYAFLLDIPEEVLLARCLNRYHCVACPVETIIAPQKSKLCATCSKPMQQRSSDSEVSLRKRIAMERACLAPVINNLAKKSCLHQISTVSSPEEYCEMIWRLTLVNFRGELEYVGG